MLSQECKYIRELLPLYAEKLTAPDVTAAIEAHLSHCTACREEWDILLRNLPDPLPPDQETASLDKGFSAIFLKLRKTVAVAVLLLAVSGAGLAYASYNAGKNIGLDDPAWRFAQELGLFTEINETKAFGELQVTLDKGLFDSTRSVIFLRLSGAGAQMPQVSLTDDAGNTYEQRSGRGWRNRYFMLEFEPLHLETEQVHVNLAATKEAAADFTVPVDVLKTAQYTTIVYPHQVKDLPELKITLEKAVLSVSETQYRLKFDWPMDYSVAGLGVGKGAAYFPTSIVQASETPPPGGMLAPGGLRSGYASAVGLGYRMDQPPGHRPALYDLTAKQEVQVEMGEYKTTEFPCQVTAILKFAPVPQDTRQLELILPAIYLYKEAKGKPFVKLDFRERNELVLNKTLPAASGRIIVRKAWLEEGTLNLQYALESLEQPETLLPHFELLDAAGMKKGTAHFDTGQENTVVFYLYEQEARQFKLTLDALGRLSPPEKFTLTLD
ncbi:MAG: zf-HC2 domain-containing protein [Clostridia bacterium]|nr:zf-HC2 domain-containing protein [Clostridia bacterium]